MGISTGTAGATIACLVVRRGVFLKPLGLPACQRRKRAKLVGIGGGIVADPAFGTPTTATMPNQGLPAGEQEATIHFGWPEKQTIFWNWCGHPISAVG